MKSIYLTIFVFIAAMLISCSKEDNDNGLSGQAITFASGISKYDTRVNEKGNEWIQGDEVGIYMLATENVNTLLKSNIKYIAASSGISTTFTTNSAMYYPTDGSAVKFMAYYPYSEPVGTEYPIDLSSQKDQAKLDLMYAKSKDSYTHSGGTAVILTFEHMLSKLILNVSAGATVGDISNTQVTVKGMNTTAVFNLLTKEISKEADADAIKAYTSETANRYEFILLPVILTDAHIVEFDVNGTIYTWNIKENDGDIDKFKTGHEYTFNIKLSESGVEAELEVEQEGSVTPWKPEGGSGNGTLEDETMLSIPDLVSTDQTTTSVDLNWNIVENAATYTYQYILASASEEDESAITTIADIATNSITISSLEENTDYKFRVKAVPAEDSEYTESAYSEWLNVSTKSSSAGEAVTSGEELLAALAAIDEGGTIYLDPANTFNINTRNETTGVYSAKSLSITKSITLEGSSSSNLARINAKAIEIAATGINFTIKNIEFSGYTLDSNTGAITSSVSNTSQSYFIDITSNGSINNLTIENCFVHGIYNGLVRANRAANALYGDVTIYNNRFYNIGGNNGGLVATSSDVTTAGTWIIKNNTVTGVGQGFYETSANKKLIVFPKEVASFTATISNNTFFGVSSGSGNYYIDTQSAGNCGTIVLEKNITVFAGASRGPRLGTNGTIKDNAVYPSWTSVSGDTNTITLTANPFGVAETGLISLDADFTPDAGTKAYGWGDPRWL